MEIDPGHGTLAEGRKPALGPRIAADISLPVIRSKCPHFHAWLTRLESLLRS